MIYAWPRWSTTRSETREDPGTGHRQQAQEQLTAATTMFREMDMSFWLEQAEAERRAAT
jgi:hypothetical protein